MPTYNLRKGSVHWAFGKSRAKIQFMGGGYGNGKTTAAIVQKALPFILDYPGSNGLIARATYPKLNDTIRKEFFKWCPSDWVLKRPTIDDNTAYMQNGSVVNFRYVSQRGQKNVDGTTTSNLLSATYDWIIVDQIEDPEITHKDLLDLMGRLRGSTPYRPADKVEDPTMPSTGPRVMVLTSNPTGNWVYTELIKPLKHYQKTGEVLDKLLWDDELNKPVIELFEGPTHINAENLPKDYIKGLEISYKGQMRERMLMGKWATYEGLVYEDWDEDQNSLSRDQMLMHAHKCIKRHVRLKAIESYDFGLTSPSCYMLGFVDDWGRVFIIDGFYQPGRHYTDQVKDRAKIVSKYAHLFDFDDPIRADPAIWKTQTVNRHKNTGETIAKLLTDLGWDMVPANNEILSGIAKVGSYISGAAEIPHVLEELGFRKPVPFGVNAPEQANPLLYVAKELDWFQNEISAYYWKKNPLGIQLDEPQDHNDHAMDGTKYLLSFQPDASAIIVPKHLRVKPWMFWHEHE